MKKRFGRRGKISSGGRVKSGTGDERYDFCAWATTDDRTRDKHGSAAAAATAEAEPRL